jgi:hypothetical protein
MAAMYAPKSARVSITAIATAVAAGLLLVGPASPTAAAQDAPYYADVPLCEAMFRFAESARAHGRSLKYRKGRGTITLPACQHDGSPASRGLCELLMDRAAKLAIPPLALNALSCLGIREPSASDPEAIVSHAFYIRGTFESQPPHFSQGKVRLEISLDARKATSRPWIAVAAIPLR